MSNNRSESELASELARHVSSDYRTRMDPDDIEAALWAMSNLNAGHTR